MPVNPNNPGSSVGATPQKTPTGGNNPTTTLTTVISNGVGGSDYKTPVKPRKTSFTHPFVSTTTANSDLTTEKQVNGGSSVTTANPSKSNIIGNSPPTVDPKKLVTVDNTAMTVNLGKSITFGNSASTENPRMTVTIDDLYTTVNQAISGAIDSPVSSLKSWKSTTTYNPLTTENPENSVNIADSITKFIHTNSTTESASFVDPDDTVKTKKGNTQASLTTVRVISTTNLGTSFKGDGSVAAGQTRKSAVSYNSDATAIPTKLLPIDPGNSVTLDSSRRKVVPRNFLTTPSHSDSTMGKFGNGKGKDSNLVPEKPQDDTESSNRLRLCSSESEWVRKCALSESYVCDWILTFMSNSGFVVDSLLHCNHLPLT